jgi:hypothetical protein
MHDNLFSISSQDQNLIGSVFLEDFSQKFLGSATLRQKLAINPAWNLTTALGYTFGAK